MGKVIAISNQKGGVGKNYDIYKFSKRQQPEKRQHRQGGAQPLRPRRSGARAADGG